MPYVLLCYPWEVLYTRLDIYIFPISFPFHVALIPFVILILNPN